MPLQSPTRRSVSNCGQKVSSFGVNDRRPDISVESVATYNRHLLTAHFVELKITAAGVNDWLCVQQFHL